MHKLVGASALMVLTVSPALANPQTYRLDPKHSVVIFETVHQDTSTVVGWFSGVDAQLVVDRASPANSTLDAYVDLSTETTREEERDKWIEDSVLKSSSTKEAHFQSTKVVSTGPTSADIFGTLTVAGVSLPDFKLSTTLVDKDDVIGISARGTLSRKAIGSVEYPTIAADKIDIRIEAEATLQP